MTEGGQVKPYQDDVGHSPCQAQACCQTQDWSHAVESDLANGSSGAISGPSGGGARASANMSAHQTTRQMTKESVSRLDAWVAKPSREDAYFSEQRGEPTMNPANSTPKLELDVKHHKTMLEQHT